jgi:hypothetical protein
MQPGLDEVLAVSALVKPYWAKLYALRQELHQLKRRSGDEALPLAAWTNINSELDILEQQATWLFDALEDDPSSANDPTGKLGLLRAAIEGFTCSCAERRKPYGSGFNHN